MLPASVNIRLQPFHEFLDRIATNSEIHNNDPSDRAANNRAKAIKLILANAKFPQDLADALIGKDSQSLPAVNKYALVAGSDDQITHFWKQCNSKQKQFLTSMNCGPKLLLLNGFPGVGKTFTAITSCLPYLCSKKPTGKRFCVLYIVPSNGPCNDVHSQILERTTKERYKLLDRAPVIVRVSSPHADREDTLHACN